MDSGWDHRALPRWDCSIRIRPDQRPLTAPRTLSWSTTSFFGCWRQGIHTYALCSLTYIGSTKPTTAAASRLTSSGARLTYLAVRCGSPPAGALGNHLTVPVSKVSFRRLGSCEPRRLVTLLGSSRFAPCGTHRDQLFGLSFGLLFASARGSRHSPRRIISLGFALLCSCQGTQGLNPDDWTA